MVPLTDTGAFSTIDDSETFDVILSNPPWVDRKPANINEFALYDEGFQLMRTLLEGLDEHLNPGGRVLLSYGSVDAIETLVGMASEMDLTVRLLADGRDVSRLPKEEFLPGLLVEITQR